MTGRPTSPRTRRRARRTKSAARHTPAPAASPAGVFGAIADPTRRRLLDTLGAGPRTVQRLARPFAMSRPAVSQHLRILREAGLVAMQRIGREHHYYLVAMPLRDVYDWVAHYEKFWKEKLASLGRYLDRTAAREKEKQDDHGKKESEE